MIVHTSIRTFRYRAENRLSSPSPVDCEPVSHRVFILVWTATVRPEVGHTSLNPAVVDRWLLVGLDGGRQVEVALATVTVDAAGFDRYEADGTTVGLDAGRLSELVGVAAGDDPVTLAVDPETWHLDVRLPGLSYGVAALDPDGVLSPPDREELEFPYTADCALPVTEIERFVGAVDLVTDYVTLAVDPAEPAFLVRADGDTDEVSVRLSGDDLPALSPGSAESLFSLVYLDGVTRAIPSGTDVALRLGEDCPVRFEYGFADGDGTVETLVSPRIRR